MTIRTYIGLGSNLGDSEQILREAVAKLAGLGPVQVSRHYQSTPMGPQDQPNYLKSVVQLDTALKALALLEELQQVEQVAGRIRLRRWGERTLDLDLLIYGQQQIQNERLTVPHIGILERDFVVIPLLDLDADCSVGGQSLQNLDLVQHSTLSVLADQTWAD